MVKKRKGKSERRKGRALFFWIFFAAAFLFFIGGVGYVAILAKNLPSPEQFSVRQINQSTRLYDRTGKILLYEIHGEEKRTVVPFEQIPDTVKKTTIVAEDADFYNEPAFDWKGILRALLVNIQHGKIMQGGSTITQQLAKNVFLNNERTITRKIKEFILSVELESKYSKDQILSFYLNQVPYGSNAYGVEAASHVYFGKSSKDLSLAEAATLAGMLQAPSYYSPWGSHTDDLKKRKDYVLDRMKELGYATKSEVDAAKSEKLTFLPPSIGSIKAPHFSLFVRDYLVNRYGENMVMNGGLRVITSLDWNLQQLAEKAVQEGSKNNEEAYGAKNAALVAEDPKTGQILAMVGSRDYFDTANEGNFNVAMQGLRQPGSALKPFVYLTAFKKGYTPDTVVFDARTEFDTRNDPQYSYMPQNFNNRVRGPVALRNALAESLNIPAVKVLYLAGIRDSLNTLHSFGITTLQETWRYGLSLVLGGGEVKLVDLVNAYATLSQEGVHHNQTSILEVDDANGNVLENYHDNATRVVDNLQYPRLVTNILSDPQLRAPIFSSSLPLTVFRGYDVALKTGTSEDHRDAWTIGYTPFLVAGVWAGNNDNTPMIRQGSSILAAAPIWSMFFREALKQYTPEPFYRPDPITPSPKPMLNGQWIWNPVVNGQKLPQIHSILYYVDRSDPTASTRPGDPSRDPQFENWELGVKNWASQNISDFFRYNTPVPLGTPFLTQQSGEAAEFTGAETHGRSPTLSITELSPSSGSFVSTPFLIRATIRADRGLKRVELYINHRMINGFDVSHSVYYYRYQYDAPLSPQNLFELKAIDTSGASTSASFIIYEK